MAIQQASLIKIIPDEGVSLQEGGLVPIGPYSKKFVFQQLEGIAGKFNFSLEAPIKNILEKALQAILYGFDENFSLELEFARVKRSYHICFEGVVSYVERLSQEESSVTSAAFKNYVEQKTCPVCKGARLKEESLLFKIAGKNIADLTQLQIDELKRWIAQLPEYLSDRKCLIAHDIVKEIQARIRFLCDIGLGYLSLNRSSKTLSGGRGSTCSFSYTNRFSAGKCSLYFG